METSRGRRFNLGRWLSGKRSRRSDLTPYEAMALTSMGMVWHTRTHRTRTPRPDQDGLRWRAA
ncbi:hypothetical protein J7E94_15325 [Streptomyces sp. ISL-94]|nr:hypothetical protein [Streptomyces sp. ISL-94]